MHHHALLTAPRAPQSGVHKEATLEIKRRCGRAKPAVYHVTDKPPHKKSQVRGMTETRMWSASSTY